MITERMVFQARYGRGDELVAWLKEIYDASPSMAEDVLGARIYTDVTGTMFTVVAESDYASLEALAAANAKQIAEYATADFQQRFARMTELVERGERQLLNCERIR